MSQVPLTARGAKLLQDELKALKTERPEISAAIATARAHGDIKENAEYHAAKEQQGLAEARILYIEGKLSNAHIIELDKVNAAGRVVFGATVHLANLDTDDKTRYQLVGEDEADIKSGLLSIGSPIARMACAKSSTEWWRGT